MLLQPVTPLNNLQPVLLILCAVGIAVSFLVPPIWLLFFKPPPRTQYKIIVMLVCFAVSAMMTLMFGTSANIQATVPIALQIGGPFAAFLGSALLILHFHDYQEEATLATNKNILHQVTRLIEATENKCEWIGYEHWKGHLDGFEEINGQEEEHFLRNILGGAYTPSEAVKVGDTRIATAFLYLTDSVVKIQRVQGVTTEIPTKIRFRSHSSYGTSKGMRSVILISKGIEPGQPLSVRKAISDIDPPQQVPEGYARLDTKTFDCLILSQYAEFPKHEDYMLVDVSRFSSENRADISFAIVSTGKTIKEPDIWQMRRSTVSTENQLPLSFRRFRSSPRFGWDEVLTQFGPWLEILDDYQTSQANVQTALTQIRDAVTESVPEGNGTADMRFGEMVRYLARSNSYNFHARQGSDTMLALFTWQ